MIEKYEKVKKILENIILSVWDKIGRENIDIIYKNDIRYGPRLSLAPLDESFEKILIKYGFRTNTLTYMKLVSVDIDFIEYLLINYIDLVTEFFTREFTGMFEYLKRDANLEEATEKFDVRLDKNSDV